MGHPVTLPAANMLTLLPCGVLQRLRAVVSNYGSLLIASRNLDFFTSFYRFLIQLLPAAVVAPLFFSGKIEFGVINQSQSAFNHILNDVSLFVYQVGGMSMSMLGVTLLVSNIQ